MLHNVHLFLSYNFLCICIREQYRGCTKEYHTRAEIKVATYHTFRRKYRLDLKGAKVKMMGSGTVV